MQSGPVAKLLGPRVRLPKINRLRTRPFRVGGIHSTTGVRTLTAAAPTQGTVHSGAGNSTVNEEEIAHFSRLSSLWWDEHGECSQLHRMNPVRMQFIREKLVETALEDDANACINEPRILTGLDVLDVGCGGGLLSESLARLGANTLGIDASSSNVQIATLHASADSSLAQAPTGHSGKLAYKHTTVEDVLSERGDSAFDVVCSMEVLEHVDNPRKFLTSCAQLVKPGGHLFLSTISRTPLAYFLTIFAAEQALRLVTPGTHTFSKFVRPEELEGFFREYRSPSGASPWVEGPGPARRTQTETRGMVFLPWTGGWTLGPRWAKWAEQSNYIFWVRKPQE